MYFNTCPTFFLVHFAQLHEDVDRRRHALTPQQTGIIRFTPGHHLTYIGGEFSDDACPGAVGQPAAELARRGAGELIAQAELAGDQTPDVHQEAGVLRAVLPPLPAQERRVLQQGHRSHWALSSAMLPVRATRRRGLKLRPAYDLDSRTEHEASEF